MPILSYPQFMKARAYNKLYELLGPALKKRIKTFDESQHPRVPAGDEHGGEFTSGGGGGAPSEEMHPNVAPYDYQNYAYGKINSDLRAGKELDAKGKQYVAAIDKAFEETPVGRVKVFRGDGAGLSADLFEKFPLPTDWKAFKVDGSTTDKAAAEKTLNDLFAGKTFTDNAYVSTSSRKSLVMDKFVSGSYDISKYGAVGLIEITGKAKAIDMDERTGMGAKEKEKLLPRSTSFTINSVSIEYHPDGERVYLHWKVKVS